jgi:hypothetical protein
MSKQKALVTIAFFIFFSGLIFAVYNLQGMYNEWYYAELYAVRDQFNTMSGVRILSERYDHDITRVYPDLSNGRWPRCGTYAKVV